MTHEEVLNEVNIIYERISNNENNLFSDGNYTEALEILIDYYEVGLIKELEKIKADLIENPIYVQCRIKGHGTNDIQELVTDVLVQAKNEIIRRLDKELFELKGE